MNSRGWRDGGAGRFWRWSAACSLLAAVVAAAIGTAMTTRRTAAPAKAPETRALLPGPPDRPFLMYVSLMPDDTFKRVVLAPLGSPDGARYATPLTCDRVYFAGSRGLCLVSEIRSPDVASHLAMVFDEQFNVLHTIALTGPPSRTRLSADGHRAAFTVFDEGHSYAEGVFSTRTTIVDTITGSVLGDLEQFTVARDGKPFAAADFNFWGVTFARGGNRFFATLRTGGRAYLIEGDVDAREASLMLPGAECPSLSPDNTRIAFKRELAGSRGWWIISLLDLSTGSVRALAAETRSVDDQVEWLDDSSLIYFLPTADGNNIWRLRADAPEAPHIFVRAGSSPAVVR
jgi:hypothetical protein